MPADRQCTCVVRVELYRPFDQSVTGFDRRPDIVRPALSNDDIVPKSIQACAGAESRINLNRLLQIGARHRKTLRSGEFEIELCTHTSSWALHSFCPRRASRCASVIVSWHRSELPPGN